MDTFDALTGINSLDAVKIGDHQYAYYAQETGAWYLVDEFDIQNLGAALRAGKPDAYSIWCAGTPATRVDDLEHDILDRIADAAPDRGVSFRCQCSRATGQRCEWTGEREDLILVRWVPDADRGSAEASGTFTRGAYARSLYVSPGCAEMLRYEYEDGERTDREDPYVRIVGPAYE